MNQLNRAWLSRSSRKAGIGCAREAEKRQTQEFTINVLFFSLLCNFVYHRLFFYERDQKQFSLVQRKCCPQRDWVPAVHWAQPPKFNVLTDQCSPSELISVSGRAETSAMWNCESMVPLDLSLNWQKDKVIWSCLREREQSQHSWVRITWQYVVMVY